MPTPVDNDEITLSFARGINNTARETALPDGAIRSAINLDIVSGVPSVREGRTLIYPSTSSHSLWSHPLLDFGVFVEGTNLRRLHSTLQVDTLHSGVQPRAMHYEMVAGRAYYSNGLDTGIIDPLGNVMPWGIECPNNSYGVQAVSGGGLHAGEYRVALTFLRGQEEGGALAPQTIVLTEGEGIQLSSLPAPTDSTVTALRVYLSNADDPRCFHVRDVALGMSSVTLGMGPHGRLCDTLFLTPMPPGYFLKLKLGRIFHAYGRFLRWSEALRYGLYDPVHNYLPFPSTLTGIGSPENNRLQLYIGTQDKTYLLDGMDMRDAKIAALIHTGIVPGSLVHLDPSDIQHDNVNVRCPVWLGTNGNIYCGTESGATVLNQTAAAMIYQKAAATFYQVEGQWRYLVAGRGGRKADLALTDKVVARVVS